MNTAANPDSDWLFPGGRAGQPPSSSALSPSYAHSDSPAAQPRAAAIQQLILQAPAPVVAQALGHHHNTATKHRSAASGTWNRYPGTRERTAR